MLDGRDLVSSSLFSELCRHRQLVVLVIFSLLFGLTFTKDSSQFVHRKLSEAELRASAELAAMHRKSWDGKADKHLSGDAAWYKKVDIGDARFSGIGLLFVVNCAAFEDTEKAVQLQMDSGIVDIGGLARALVARKPVERCTAFYVADDILATAAHCVENALRRSEDGRIAVFFRQQFDGSVPFTDEMAESHERIVQEWIYPRQYRDGAQSETGTDKRRKAMQFDYAFLRIHGRMHGDTVYTLARPDAFFKAWNAKERTQLKLLGYPGDYNEHSELVSLSGGLFAPDDDLVLEDEGMELFEEAGRPLHSPQNKAIFCIGRGSMLSGASGGPWLLAENVTTAGDTAREELLRLVIGMTGWGPGGVAWQYALAGSDDSFSAVFADTQRYRKVTAAAMLDENAMRLYNSVMETPNHMTFLEFWEKSAAKRADGEL